MGKKVPHERIMTGAKLLQIRVISIPLIYLCFYVTSNNDEMIGNYHWDNQLFVNFETFNNNLNTHSDEIQVQILSSYSRILYYSNGCLLFNPCISPE